MKEHELAFASISEIEVLGYHKIGAAEADAVREILDSCWRLELTQQVIHQAIKLRQRKRIGLGDAIVAATALENNAQLWTANTDDFKHISNLVLVNPL